jgi:hypothetical protein
MTGILDLEQGVSVCLSKQFHHFFYLEYGYGHQKKREEKSTEFCAVLIP